MTVGEVSGQPLEHCRACGGVWISRSGILALRSADDSEHPALRQPPASGARPDRDLRCPGCDRRLETFRYRGGKAEVDKCPECDRVFLDRGELRTVLDEWRGGFEMSDGAKAALAASHARAAARISADTAAGGVAAGVVALVVAGYALEELWWWEVESLVWYVAVPGAMVAAVLFVMGRAKRAREVKALHHAAAAERLLGTKRAERSARETKEPRCPWCRAKVPEGATHCEACDSDII